MFNKIEIVKGLIANHPNAKSLTLRVPTGYYLFAAEFKALDKRITKVEPNDINGWSVVEEFNNEGK